MQTIHWEVQTAGTPAVYKYCKRCGIKTEFICSKLFRVNAQQKSLDIWLIFKCSNCDTTWNMTIYSRVNPRSLNYSILEKYTNNDTELAVLHAVDSALLKRNGVEPVQPEINIIGNDFNLSEPATIYLSTNFPLEVKISAILRDKMNLSRSTFDRFCKNGNIVCVSGHDIHKYKMRGEIIIRYTP